jgi:hypothetical protein
MSVGIGVIAGGPEFFLAKQAAATSNRKWHHHSVAATEIGNLFADLLDDAHEFVS